MQTKKRGPAVCLAVHADLLSTAIGSVTREALAQSGRCVANASVGAGGNVLVLTSRGREELVNMEDRRARRDFTSAVTASGTPVSAQVSGDDVGHEVHLIETVNGRDTLVRGEAILDVVLIVQGVETLGSVEIDVRRIAQGHFKVQHGEYIGLVQAVENVSHLSSIVVANLARNIAVVLSAQSGIIGNVSHVDVARSIAK